LSAQELSRKRNTLKSLERRLYGIDNRIAEREVIFLRSADGVFLAGIAPQKAMLADDMKQFL